MVAGCLANVAGFAWTGPPYPSGNVTLNITASSPGCAVAPDFVGTAIGSQYINGRGYTPYFNTGTTQLVNLYKAIGITHMRTIQGAWNSSQPEPTAKQLDSFFDFCAAAGVQKVIFSLHLRNIDQETNTWTQDDVVKHIWTTTTTNGTVEKNLIDSFALDNEPDAAGFMGVDTSINNYSQYLAEWKKIANKIASECPGCAFSGPDALCNDCDGWCDTRGQTPSNQPWDIQFANDVSSYNFLHANQHCYVGGPRDHGHDYNENQYANAILNNDWDTGLFVDIDNTLGTHSPLSVPLRYTEAMFFADNSPTNHIFATGLAFLDFYHWQARHCVQGIDAMSNPFQFNAVIFKTGNLTFEAMPMGYAQKFFNMGSQGGDVIYASKFGITNPKGIAMTAYGVVNGNELYVTIINKSGNFMGAPYIAHVSIPQPSGFTVQHAKSVVLEGAGATLYSVDIGGATLPVDGSAFNPTWNPVSVSSGNVTVNVQPASAMLVVLENY